VFEDFFYDVFGLNESDDGHRPMALRTRQGIDFAKVCARVGGLPANRVVLKEGCNLSHTVNATDNRLTS